MFRPAALAILLLPALPAVASAPKPDADLAAHAYVQGRLALAGDDLDAAARRFAEAMKVGADDGLKRRALDVALMSGDLKNAVQLANAIDLTAAGPAPPGANSLVALTRAAGAAAARDWGAFGAARAAFAEPDATGSTAIISTLLDAYGLAGRGQMQAALALVDPDTSKGIARSYLAEHRGHLLVLARRWPEAADAFGALIAAEGAGVTRLRLAAVASALEASRTDASYRAKAISWLGSGGERDQQLQMARDRLAANPALEGRKLGGLIERPTDGLALLFLRVSTDLGRERAVGPALGFARLATLLAPQMPEAWLVTTDALVKNERTELALAALKNLPSSPPWDEQARARRAAILIGARRFDEARALLAPEAAKPGATADDWLRLAEVERRAGNATSAAEAYGRALLLMADAPAPQRAQILFLRGSAREQAGAWEAAEADLRAAVELAPDNAVYLNYLGYSLLDRRLKTAEAKALIARAFKAAPENGAVIDSMGWAEFLTGNIAEAVRLLDMARAAEPADPTVADHLGDALWRAGRHIEARHAWAAARALDPEPKLAALLARKLDFGLDLALAER